MKNIKILFVSKMEQEMFLLRSQLVNSGYEVDDHSVKTKEELDKALELMNWDIVICDYSLDNLTPFLALETVKNYYTYLPFVVFSNRESYSEIVYLIKSGCDNYIDKNEVSGSAKIIENEIIQAQMKKKHDMLNKRIEVTLDCIGDGVITVDRKGNINYINKSAEKITEWENANAIGMSIEKVFNIIHSKTKETLESPFKRVIETEQSTGLNEDTMLVSKGGTQYYISANFSPIMNKDNYLIGVVIVFRDISTIKTLEIRIKKEREIALKSRNLYLSLLEECPALVCKINKDCLIEYLNNTFIEYTGEHDIQRIRNNLHNLIHPDEYHNVVYTISSSILLKTQFKIEGRLLNKSGEYRNFILYGNPLLDTDGSFMGCILLAMDIDEIKRLEEKLILAKQAAESADRAKSVFLASMSHEIRTPLNGIGGMLELTMMTELTKEQRENLEIAKECSYSLMEVINNILDFSKIEAGKMEIKKVKFNIKDMIENIVKSNKVHADNKGIKLFSTIEDDIEVDIDKPLLGDITKIKQVLNNLISNAIKFTNVGEVRISLKILNNYGEKIKLQFSVVDTGIGIAPEDIDKLFKSFTQIDGSYTRQYGGTGLGLVISKKLADLMGGSIFVESTKGIGSTFHFIIELENIKEQVSNTAAYKESKFIDKKNNSPKDILLVEDDIANQMVISQMCSKMGYNILVSNNGKEALTNLKKHKFDVILMDIQMPIMDGITTTKYIRENEKVTGEHMPIIALTAYALKEDREKFINAGMDDYLSKPLEMGELFQCIDKITNKHITTYQFLNETNNILDVSSNSSKSIGTAHIFEDKRFCIEKLDLVINNLKESIVKENFNICEACTHAIKEYSINVNSVILKNASFRAELASRRKDIDGIKNQIPIIEEEFYRLKKLL